MGISEFSYDPRASRSWAPSRKGPLGERTRFTFSPSARGVAGVSCPGLAGVVPNDGMTWLEEVAAMPDSWIIQP